jgi:hypothetical protein
LGQLYLALAALRQARDDLREGKAGPLPGQDRAESESLRRLARRLAFPPGHAGPRRPPSGDEFGKDLRDLLKPFLR